MPYSCVCRNGIVNTMNLPLGTAKELRKLYAKEAQGMTDEEIIDMDRRLSVLSNLVLDRIEWLQKNDPKELKRIINEGEKIQARATSRPKAE